MSVALARSSRAGVERRRSLRMTRGDDASPVCAFGALRVGQATPCPTYGARRLHRILTQEPPQHEDAVGSHQDDGKLGLGFHAGYRMSVSRIALIIHNLSSRGPDRAPRLENFILL